MALTRAQKKFVAIQRARRRLEHRLADIDWELDELSQDVKKIGELETTHTIEIEVGDVQSDDQD